MVTKTEKSKTYLAATRERLVNLLFNKLESFYSHKNSIAVCVEPHSDGATHSSILFSEGSIQSKLHLKDHRNVALSTNLTHNAKRSGYYIEKLYSDRELPKFNAAIKLLKLIAQNNKVTIPYGLNFSGGRFDANAQLVLKNGIGLTCATFTLTCLSSIGYDILRLRTWKTRKYDCCWKESMLSYYQDEQIKQKLGQATSAGTISNQDIINLINDLDVKTFRYRPADVVAGFRRPGFRSPFMMINWQTKILERHIVPNYKEKCSS